MRSSNRSASGRSCPHCGRPEDPAYEFCPGCGATQPRAEYSAPDPPPPDPERTPRTAYGAVGPAVEYAGFGWRLLAVSLDLVITTIAASVVGIVGAALGEGVAGAAGARGIAFMQVMDLLAVVASIAIAWLYEALLVSSSWQATLGKRAVGIVVTDLWGGRISFARATGRWLGKYVSGFILGIGYLIQPFTERRQALHDTMAGCLVLRNIPRSWGSDQDFGQAPHSPGS